MGCVRSLVRDTPRSAVGPVDAISAERGSAIRVRVRSIWIVAIQHVVRLRVVSVSGRRVASLLSGTLDRCSSIRMDMGWGRTMGLSDTPLRPLGLLGGRVVLDSRTHLGTGVGVVGLRAWVRELVSAWLEQSSGPA